MTRSDSARRPAVVQHAFDALVAALRSRLHQGRDIPIDACDRFDHSLADLAGTTIAGAREAGAGDGVAPSLPVLAQLPGAFVAARDAVPDLAEPLEIMLPALRWTQNPNYRRRPPSADFLTRYGYAQFVGPADVPTLLANERLALGVLMLGPGTIYPAHSHPAEELYVPLAPARWQRGEETWRDRRAGDLVHHPSGMMHATEAGEAPLLALYLWLGDLGTAAEILGS
jgi:quercetin dioxygenase-like cupin family protein